MVNNHLIPTITNGKINVPSTVFRPWTVLLCIVTLILSSMFIALPIEWAVASSYGALSTEQKVVAEAWRLVDNSFLDRTFNHQDWFALRQKYVVQTKYKNMEEAQNAIAAMVNTLGDKYTRYLTPSQYQSLVDSATGVLSNGGVGIEITKNSQTNQIYASDIQENSPAAKAGIQINDIFVQVDGQPITESNTPDDVAVLLRGPMQSKVGVVMQNHITQQNVDYILQRQPITITAVQSYLTTYGSNKVGVIRIKNFSSTTASVVQATIQDLQKKGNPAYYLIDLRGNPGGLLPGGVDTASLFLPDNVPVVYVVNKSGIADTQSTLVPGLDTTTPVTILVDKNTASAAEVFTAALQENHRAMVIGEQTFGKGIVQTIRELSDKNGGIAITVARYETPLRHDINQQGIAVNIPTPVDCPKNDATMCIKNFINTNNNNNQPIFQVPPT
jgi:carboxyl-terminal processing protease